MKIKAKANGNIVDVSDGEAEALLASGIYEPVEKAPAPKPKKDALLVWIWSPRFAAAPHAKIGDVPTSGW